MFWRLSWNGLYLGKDTSIWPGFQNSYSSNLRLVLCKILILFTNSIFFSEGLFIYIYFLLFEENHQDRISRSEEKILQRLNPIWTGLFADLKDWDEGILVPLHNLEISSQKTMKHGKGILWAEIFTYWQKCFVTSSSCWFYDVIKMRQLKR